jgi:hypothetical protein
MQTISSIQETDTSAIDRLEADRAKQRQEVIDAANAATRRAALLKSGAGVGAAAVGVGLGALLVLYGVSLLMNRPTLEEVTTAMRAQAATFERLVNEKVETIKTEAANKVAAAESATAAKASEADKAVAQARAVTEKFTSSSSGKTVVDFSIFRTQAINGLVVRTGWKYQKTDDPAPSSQWCYIEKTSVPDGLNLQIATDGIADPFNPGRAAKAGVTWSEVQKALPYCDWFKGANPNIREKGAGRS